MGPVTDPGSIQPPAGFHPDRPLDRADLDPDPITQFRSWLTEAEVAGIALPNAMALATADTDGRPSVRNVLLRGVDERGFVFFTNYESRKARQLASNPHAGLVFYWKELDRQVCVTGDVQRADEEESDAYFATRPRDAQIGAWASRQSAEIAGRDELDARVAEVEARFAGEVVPRPEFWGGFRVIPDALEFWQGRAHRLHDRFRYELDASDPAGWRLARLSP
jgi:pyridoxamine 5'-phosphate oxidase